MYLELFVITICEEFLLLRIDWNGTVINALNFCWCQVLQLGRARLCDGKQVPLQYCPYYKLKLCIKQQRFIVFVGYYENTHTP